MVNRFWDMMEKARCHGDGNLDQIYENLFNDLMRLEIPEIILWGKILEEYYRLADSTELYAVASELGDTEYHEYMDFCGWLLSRGRDFFFSVLQRPQMLLESDLLSQPQEDDFLFQELRSLPISVYLRKRNMQEWDNTRYQYEASRYPLSDGIYQQLQSLYSGSFSHARNVV